MTTLLSPEARAVLALADPAAPPFETGTPAAARAAYDASRGALRNEPEPVGEVRDIVIDTPAGPLAARLYRGIDAPATAAPALLYLHGGGWVLGNLESHDEVCRRFANAAGALVLCPDYRLAPEHKFPAAVEDAQAALAYLRTDAAALRIDPRRIAVAGDSAAATSPPSWRSCRAAGTGRRSRRNCSSTPTPMRARPPTATTASPRAPG